MRRLVCLAVLLSVSGCGVLLGEPFVREQDRLTGRRAGLSEPAGSLYGAATTAAFDARNLRATLALKLTRTRLCRRFTENVFERTTVTGHTVAMQGALVDGAVLAAAAAAGVFVAGVGAKAFMAAAGAVPLGADAYTGYKSTSTDPVTVTTRVPEPGRDTDSQALFPCGVTGETAAALFAGDRELARRSDGAYVLALDETTLAAKASTTSVELDLSLHPPAGAPVTVPVKALLGPAYTEFAVTRDTARRFPTPVRIARFTAAYPRSEAAAGLRRYLLTLLPAMQDAGELREAAGVPGIAGELRRALHERFEEIYVDDIVHRLPGLLRDAALAERNANTFLLNGFEADGRRVLAEKAATLAEACRLYRDFKLRGGDTAALDRSLSASLAPGERRMADAWLAGCP